MTINNAPTFTTGTINNPVSSAPSSSSLNEVPFDVIKDSIASTIAYLRGFCDDQEVCFETALSKLEPALFHVDPEWYTNAKESLPSMIADAERYFSQNLDRSFLDFVIESLEELLATNLAVLFSEEPDPFFLEDSSVDENDMMVPDASSVEVPLGAIKDAATSTIAYLRMSMGDDVESSEVLCSETALSKLYPAVLNFNSTMRILFDDDEKNEDDDDKGYYYDEKKNDPEWMTMVKGSLPSMITKAEVILSRLGETDRTRTSLDAALEALEGVVALVDKLLLIEEPNDDDSKKKATDDSFLSPPPPSNTKRDASSLLVKKDVSDEEPCSKRHSASKEEVYEADNAEEKDKEASSTISTITSNAEGATKDAAEPVNKEAAATKDDASKAATQDATDKPSRSN